MLRREVLGGLLASLALMAGAGGIAPTAAAADTVADVVVYGGTPSGVIAAVTSARHGSDVILLEPTDSIGGIMSNGLVFTDIGDRATVGGVAGEFFDRVAAWYAAEGITTRWRFQPHVALAVFEDMLQSAGVVVVRRAALQPNGVVKDGTTIMAIETTAGSFGGHVFIDASYGGDLMAAAGVAYTVGREATTTYGEPLAGVRPSSTVMTVSGSVPAYLASVPAPGVVGSGDGRVQAANYRMCFSADPATQVPFSEPPGYDRALYGVVADYLAAIPAASLRNVLTASATVANMYDVNESGSMSSALPGSNWGWAEGSAEQRTAIELQHADYDRGLVWFLASDPGVPQEIRSELGRYGWCATEWGDNDHFPKQLYIREARRMLSADVLTQADISTSAPQSSAIGIGSYRVDSHGVTRWVEGNVVKIEGFMYQPYTNYPIPFDIMLPRESEADNLVVSVTVSASHVAWASLRMEPHFMIMGEAAGAAASLAVARTVPMQAVPVADIQAALRLDGAVLPGTTVAINFVAPGPATVGSSTYVTVRAVDAFGNPTPGYQGTVHFTSTDGTATLPPDTLISGSYQTVTFRFRTAGPQWIRATDLLNPALTAVGTITVQPGPTVAFNFVAPGPATVGSSTYVTVRAVDAFGNPTPGYQGTVHFTSTDGTATLPPDTLISGSYQTVTFRFRTAGPQWIRATDLLNPALTAVGTITVQPGPTVAFNFVAPGPATVGSSTYVTVRAVDAFGNPTPGYQGTVHFTSTDGTATLPPDTLISGSYQTVTFRFRTAGPQWIRATDLLNPALTAVGTITVQPGPTVAFNFVAPGPATVGSSTYVTVRAVDAFGNPTPGYQGTVHFTSTDGTATLPPDTLISGSYQTVTFRFRTAGPQWIRATDLLNPALTAVGTITVEPGPTVAFNFVAPGPATVGSSTYVTVRAVDAFGNPTPGYQGTVHFTSTDGTATLPPDTLISGSYQTVTFRFRTAGPQWIRATDLLNPALTAVGTITVQPGPTVAFTPGADRLTAGSTRLSPRITLSDAEMASVDTAVTPSG